MKEATNNLDCFAKQVTLLPLDLSPRTSIKNIIELTQTTMLIIFDIIMHKPKFDSPKLNERGEKHTSHDVKLSKMGRADISRSFDEWKPGYLRQSKVYDIITYIYNN